MAGSQLKRLKASLREQGIIGPQQSKIQKKKKAQQPNSEKRVQRSEALASIREQYNPFQFKTNARGPKHNYTTVQSVREKANKAISGISGRPLEARSKSENKRRQTLLVEMQRRNKVGGINDRRFGESDPNMSLDQKMAERYAQEVRRRHKKSIFDLEEEEPTEGLTHGGKRIFSDDEDEAMHDDFDKKDLPSDGEGSDSSQAERKRFKRLHGLTETAEEGEAAQPERKKSRREILQEIIAKSKAHKYERQAIKETDEDLRNEIDKGFSKLQELMHQKPKPKAQDEKESGPIVAGMDKAALNKDYDLRLKQLAADQRAAPTERTKTAEERAAEESQRLKELEQQRLRRMQGKAAGSDDEQEEKEGVRTEIMEADDDRFGLGKGIRMRATATELGLDDEDDFLIENDLIASGTEPADSDEEDTLSDEECESASEGSEEENDHVDQDAEFSQGLLTEAESKDMAFEDVAKSKGDDLDGVPYIFPCPQNLDELQQVFEPIPLTKLAVVVQRIRALFCPSLGVKNKEKLGNFSAALVRFVAVLARTCKEGRFAVIERLTRHIHSLAKTFPIEIGKEFRARIQEMEEQRALALDVGDLIILTGLGTVFPTSDHWHQVVTPALIAMCRYLGQKTPETLADYCVGAYLAILAVQFQRLSKRYIPEVVNFCLNALCALSPQKSKKRIGFVPLHEPPAGIRIKNASETPPRKLNCNDCLSHENDTTSTRIALMSTMTSVLQSAADTWSAHPSFIETFAPATLILAHLASSSCAPHLPPFLVLQVQTTTAQLTTLISSAHRSRRPLMLHNHRPLPIRTHIPKFEHDGFDPTRHYDPDRERAALKKLRAEHKREKKGALRELRRDAAFMAREKVRQKRERDEAYERKFKHIVAEIQGEEGRAANEYQRERKLIKLKRWKK